MDFPIENGDFPIAMLNYQRVSSGCMGILSDKPIFLGQFPWSNAGDLRFIFQFHLGHGQKLDHSHWICGVGPLSAHICSCSLKNDDPEKDSKTM